MRNLPPLTAIKAFEAAARLGSVKQAASELFVTAAAVSLQVKQLEEWLGVALFERAGKGLALTAKGRHYCEQLTMILGQLASATEQVRGDQLAGSLRLTALPSFAHAWLLPRLASFRACHPDIDLVLDTDSNSQNLMGKKFDLAIRSGTGRWPGMQADLIAGEAFAPMCSPALLAGPPGLASPGDLRKHALLHSTPREGWERWLALAGVTGIDTSKGLTLNDSSLCLKLAMEGQGVALGRTFLAASELAAGNLVMPFEIQLDNDYSYWLVYPTASADLPRIKAFREWIIREAKNSA
jgi:LysR family glycine cleavage system transcriptional activator